MKLIKAAGAAEVVKHHAGQLMAEHLDIASIGVKSDAQFDRVRRRQSLSLVNVSARALFSGKEMVDEASNWTCQSMAR